MKIRLPAGQCIVAEDNGKTIIKSADVSTYRAIVRLRQFVEARMKEIEELEKDDSHS